MANPNLLTDKLYNQNLQYYDHIAQLFQKAPTVNSTLSISGANEKSDYSITAGYNKQTSNIVGNGDYTKYHLSTNLGTTLYKGFSIRSSTQLVYTQDALNQYFTNGGNTI